jgi:hypothetical protein
MKCDICHEDCGAEMIDGATKPRGKWANMCRPCFTENGFGLGNGVGQLYKKNAAGKYAQVEGGICPRRIYLGRG